ncbi:DUF333 domain-containing protein [Candidatus Micrarchaeota archaeon]|nr:DUF333 domain-containing protein [Candidatus Micrarchaeota archaeon]
MDVKEKLLITAFIALVAVAVYLAFIAPQPPPPPDSGPAEGLLAKAVEVGKGQNEYFFSFRETSDGYSAEYDLLAKNGQKMMEVRNPLATKQLYFLSNDIVLCAQFMNVQGCSSVINNTDAAFQNYLLSLQSRFFDNTSMDTEKEDMDYFIQHGYLTISPEIADKSVNGHACSEISYAMDFTNMTSGELYRFGISPDSPQRFDWKLCIDNSTGLVYSKHFSYSYQGKEHQWEFILLGADWNPAQQIAPPENLTEGLAYEILVEEMEWQAELRSCYDETGDTRDKCFSDLALELKMRSICELAGAKRDQCIVRLVPMLLDDSLCTLINNATFKDDCYVELAGGNKESSYCSMIADATKREFCMNISVPTNQTGIPNPAAVNCENKGYAYEIRSNEAGEYGVCSYGGRECEEWALYRGECCLLAEDCSGGVCTNGICIVPETGNATGGNSTDPGQFMQYIDPFGEDNETGNTTNSSGG